MKLRSTLRVFLGALLLAGLAACSVLKAREAEDAGFLPYPQLLRQEKGPFHKMSVYDRAKFEEMRNTYRFLYLRDVSTDILEEHIRHTAPTEKTAMRRIEEAREVARYMRERFKMALREYENHPLSIVEGPGPGTFILDMAIVELEPTNPVVNTIGTVAGALVPGGGLVRFAGTGSIAFESTLRDGETEMLYVQFKDRESDKQSLVSVKDFQEYAHVREAIDDWAAQFAEFMASTPDHVVSDSLPFSVSPL